MNTTKDGTKGVLQEGLRLRFLKPAQIKRIDDLLSQLGDYGEVHLVIQHGELRYINKVESFKAWQNDEDS